MDDNSLQPADTRRKVLHDDIARRAQELWEQYGRPQERDLEIWLEAERQLLGADPAVKTEGQGSVSAPQLAESTRGETSASKPRRTGNAPSPEDKKFPPSEGMDRSGSRGSKGRKSSGR